MKNINWKKVNGLIPAIIQNADTEKVLMLGYMNEESLKKTREDKKVWFYSRTKQRLWMKGEESGNILNLVDIKLDCDQDTLLISVNPVGPTCHTGRESCFENCSSDEGVIGQSRLREGGVLNKLFQTILSRKESMPKNSYTTSLFKDGLDEICAKVEEEAEEVCRAAKSETKQRLIEEAADVIYHLWVLIAAKGAKLSDVQVELRKRSNK